MVNPGKAAAALAWVLVFAYSWAPFDASLAVPRSPNSSSWQDLALHTLAFAALGVASRIGQGAISRDLGLCLIIELGQIFMPARHPEVSDFVVNSGAIVIGHLIFVKLVLPIASNRKALAGDRTRSPLRLLSLASYCVVWWSLLLLPLRLVSLEHWSNEFPLLLGNERDRSRPWQGEIGYLAVYGRALRASEVEMLQSSGSPERSRMGLLRSYDFSALSEHDLILNDHAHLNREDAALVLEREGQVTSAASGEFLSDHIAARGSFSVEIRLKPATLAQSGPARIVSISESPWRRNFTLGQEDRTVIFRVRNGFNGPNGDAHEFRCQNVLPDAFTHLVVTYDRGVSALFRDGHRICAPLDLREPSVILRLGTTRVARVVTAFLAALSFLLIFDGGLGATLIAGYAIFAAPLAFGMATGSLPALSLYYSFGLAVITCWFFMRDKAPVSPSR